MSTHCYPQQNLFRNKRHKQHLDQEQTTLINFFFSKSFENHTHFQGQVYAYEINHYKKSVNTSVNSIIIFNEADTFTFLFFFKSIALYLPY